MGPFQLFPHLSPRGKDWDPTRPVPSLAPLFPWAPLHSDAVLVPGGPPRAGGRADTEGSRSETNLSPTPSDLKSRVRPGGRSTRFPSANGRTVKGNLFCMFLSGVGVRGLPAGFSCCSTESLRDRYRRINVLNNNDYYRRNKFSLSVDILVSTCIRSSTGDSLRWVCNDTPNWRVRRLTYHNRPTILQVERFDVSRRTQISEVLTRSYFVQITGPY